MSYLALNQPEWLTQLDRLRAGEIDSFMSEEVPEDAYHGLHDIVSAHGLEPINDSALEYKYKRDNPITKPSPAMILGSGIHQWTINKNLDGWKVIPNSVDFTTKEGKALKELLGDYHPNKIIRERYLGMRDAFEKHDAVAQFIEPRVSHREVCIFWRDKELGILRRSRIDMYSQFKRAVIELKTTAKWTEKQLQYTAEDLGYYRQLAYYTEALAAVGLEVKYHFIIWLKSDEPFDVAVWLIPDADIAAAHTKNRSNLNYLVECQRSGIWPGRYPSIKEMGSYRTPEQED